MHFLSTHHTFDCTDRFPGSCGSVARRRVPSRSQRPTRSGPVRTGRRRNRRWRLDTPRSWNTAGLRTFSPHYRRAMDRRSRHRPRTAERKQDLRIGPRAKDPARKSGFCWRASNVTGSLPCGEFAGGAQGAALATRRSTPTAEDFALATRTSAPQRVPSATAPWKSAPEPFSPAPRERHRGSSSAARSSASTNRCSA